MRRVRLYLASAALAAFFVGAVAAAGADSFTLTVVSQNSTTITFSYPQQSGYGYLYSANGTVVARTNDPSRTQVKFAKASSYEVAAIVKGATGSYPTVTPPPPPPPAAVCGDGLDNDGDGKIDLADPGCSSLTDTDESDSPPPPPPPPGPSTMTPTQFRTACAAGPVANVEVTGQVNLPAGCHATNVTFDSWFALADNVVITGCAALAFDGTNGSSGWTLDSCVFDAHGTVDNNKIYDDQGRIPRNWHILRSTFRNFYDGDGNNHSEALYIGYSDGGEIRGNTFVNNGTTSHIFFTWWGDVANPAVSYARNICVAGNTFKDGPDVQHYYDVNFRAEIPTSSGIIVQRDASSTSPQFYGDC